MTIYGRHGVSTPKVKIIRLVFSWRDLPSGQLTTSLMFFTRLMDEQTTKIIHKIFIKVPVISPNAPEHSA